MKKKTINKVINTKFAEFLTSITDERVQKLVADNSIISGGCIASMLMKEEVNDYDIYFTNKETVKAVAEYYVKQWNVAHNTDGYVLDGANMEKYAKEFDSKGLPGGVGLNMTADRIKIIFKSSGVVKEQGAIDDSAELEEWPDGKPVVNEESKPKYRPIYISCNAITLSQKIQIVLRFYGEPEHIHLHYDYVHCTSYWLSKDKQVVLNQPALEALMAKELVYIGSKYPLASVIRTRKFLKRGFSCNAGQYLKMAFQISALDLTDLAVLEDQLIGVDVAYFQQLIDALVNHAKKEESEGRKFVLEYGYLASIVDKIF